MKVELPRRCFLRVVPIFVRKGNPHLDDLKKVDIAPHSLIMVVRRRLERANRSRYDAWKFGILGVA